MAESLSLTIRVDDVRSWVQRRADLLSEVAAIDEKLRAVRVLMPAVADMLATERLSESRSAVPDSTSLNDRPMTELVLWALRDEKGGRDPRWIRSYLSQIPEIAHKVESKPTNVGNAAVRLVERGRLVKHDNLYYLPTTLERIKAGEIEEERVANGASPTFNRLMRDVLGRYGKPFAAADAIRLAKADPRTASLVEANPNRVYSWLGRETFKKKLIKEGELYRLPSNENEAPNGHAEGASEDGKAATSHIESRGGNYDLLS